MKCIAADNSGNPFDVENGLGRALIKTGIVREWQPPKPKDLHRVTWTLCEFQSTHEPYILGKCSTCVDPLPVLNPSKAPAFRHKDGHLDFCPDDVMAEYNNLKALLAPKPRPEREPETFRMQM
jgi:hypothetical protein